MNAIIEPNPTDLHATIKLGIDADAKWFYVGRHLDRDAAPNVAGVCDAITRKNKQSFMSSVSEPKGSHPLANSMRGLFFHFPLFFTKSGDFGQRKFKLLRNRIS